MTFPRYWTGEKLPEILYNPDNMHGAEIRCFLGTTTEAVRSNPLRPVTIEPVFLDNFRE